MRWLYSLCLLDPLFVSLSLNSLFFVYFSSILWVSFIVRLPFCLVFFCFLVFVLFFASLPFLPRIFASFLITSADSSVDCVLYAVGKPVYHKSTNVTYGSWLKDSHPRTKELSEKIWTTYETHQNIIYEFADKTSFRNSQGNELRLKSSFQVRAQYSFLTPQSDSSPFTWLIYTRFRRETHMWYTTDHFTTIKREVPSLCDTTWRGARLYVSKRSAYFF